MKNSNSSAVNLGKIDKKQTHNTTKNCKQSSKSPLRVRDINALSSSSSSSISIDASRGGCLRFILSHPHSSSSSSSVINAKIGGQKPKSSVRTPKSAPNIKNLRGNSSNLQNLEKPSVRRVDKLRKQLVPGSRSGVCETSSSRVPLKLSENAQNSSPVVRFGGECELENLGGIGLELVDKEINNESDFPIQASVSPEIQGGSISAGTCYAAGHVLSGVTDRRKCRPRGILTVGDNDLFKTDASENRFKEKLPRLSLAPSPFQASIHWFKEDKDNGAKNDSRFNQCCVPFTSVTRSSASLLWSPGFSSDRSNSTSTTTTHTSTSMSCHESSSNFRGLLGPSFDHLVCSPSRSPICVGLLTPVSKGSTGSGNVIQTPTSTSSSSNLPLWDSGKDNVSRPPLFERELDSLTEVLAEASFSPEIPPFKKSFEFIPLIQPSCSIDFNIAHPYIDTKNALRFPESLGLEICDVDDSDCCRCFSDEEDPYKHDDPFE